MKYLMLIYGNEDVWNSLAPEDLDLHIAPVVLDGGMRLLDDLGLAGKEAIELTPIRVIQTPAATHLRYRVLGRAPLVPDDRGM
ncbi:MULTISPECIES: hypothetical protein [unclassified Kribbella]|uniref:hypothetical protein n=1 Tax=unclassified Kribbella TaxID=2644121 RepID=UPI0033F23513